MNIETLFNILRHYHGSKCTYKSIDNLKELVQKIHDDYMVDSLIDVAGVGWAATGISIDVPVLAKEDINLVVELIKLFQRYHPELDEFLSGLTYFQNYCEDIGSKFLFSAKTFDKHNLLLRKSGGIWKWTPNSKNILLNATIADEFPRAIRKTTRTGILPKNPNLSNVMDMVEESYQGLNNNFIECIKHIIETDISSSGSLTPGYKPDIIEAVGASSNEPIGIGHGFQIVGDIGYTDILSFNQIAIRLLLTSTYTGGVLRLINHLGYPNSQKYSPAGFTDLPNINISIENNEITIDYLGNKNNTPSTKTNNDVLKPEK